jgi:hypothetical protein
MPHTTTQGGTIILPRKNIFWWHFGYAVESFSRRTGNTAALTSGATTGAAPLLMAGITFD